MQPIKTDEQLVAMREGGQILAQIFRDLRAYVQPGMTKLQIDAWVGEQITRHGATATYRTPEVNFDGNICISLNEEIVHGLPDDTPIEAGDMVSFDLVITYKTMKTDSAFTMIVGAEPKGAVKHLMQATERSLYAGIDAIKGDGTRVGDISAAIEHVLTQAKVGIVRQLVGHGVGHQMHMAPEIPNYGHAGTGSILREGDTIALEPMATLGSENIVTQADGWTIGTSDGSLSAHFEHTVLVTNTGAEILT